MGQNDSISLDGPAQFGSFIFFFIFIFFLFLISFISFAFEFQIDSNQFVKFSKIQNINTKQQGASFHGKTNFQKYFICLPNMALFAYSKI
jgi:hypothetical protein